MQFNSIIFIVFVFTVCVVYHIINKKLKPWFLLGMSIFFYGYWTWWAPVFLTAYALAIFLIAQAMEKNRKHDLFFSILGIALSVTLFIGFRYGGMFGNLSDILNTKTGLPIAIIFPLGFSYYMFKCLSYLFDIYQEKISTEKRFRNFLLYVSYFPEIIMGPISRAVDFIPQIYTEKLFKPDTINRSFLLILIAYAKKLIIADNLAALINFYTVQDQDKNGLSWLLICCAFCIELYLDFSAYSDISIAISNILGFNIKPNFNAPFFSLTISDYWRRWHISLSSWLSDYVFTPLQFLLRRLRIYASVIAAVLTLLLSGLWHGSTLNWLFYGLFMGLVIGFEALVAKKRKAAQKKMPTWLFSIISHASSLLMVVLLSVFIISKSFSEAKTIFSYIFNPSTYSLPYNISFNFIYFIVIGCLATIFSHITELNKEAYLNSFFATPIFFRFAIYLVLIFAIISLGVSSNDIYGGFIYAQY
jgi:alginate O-acetyltransferase complex protein AlgI